MSKIINSLLLLILLISFSEKGVAQKSWQEISTVEDVYTNYPNVIINMLGQFNLEYKGLEKVKLAYADDNIVLACNELLAYYKNGSMAPDLRKATPKKTNETRAVADTTLTDVLFVQNVRGKVPVGADGHRDWYYKGPNNDKEWAWLSNRHSQLSGVYSTYLETGNPKYAEYIDLFLRDFIIKSMPYPAVKSSTSVWRGLEVSFRAKVWPKIFFGLLNSEYITPATQLLILSSLPDHAHYNRNFHSGNNWLTMEISALATVAAYFPEFKKSDAWLDYAIGAMTESMKDQVYADGVQTELTSHYHNVSLLNFELFKEICDKANKELPDFFNKTIKAMYSYISHVVRPSGYRILNNDGDKGSDRKYILKGAKLFNHPDWEYIATNGETGTKPTDGPSYFYPWAGHFVSRSGFDADAQWSFFDIGPWGSGHQHNDKLHLSISAYGRDLLVDSGRFAYTGEVAEKFRPYAKGSAGHNLILIDGKGQQPGPKLAEKPVDQNHFKIRDNFDYASNSFDQFIDLKGNAKHTRSIFYVRGEFWVVIDRITTDTPRKIDALWHWHPENKVVQNGQIVSTNNTRGNLAIIPVGKQNFDIKFTSGQENPEIQGWYSPEYNLFEPNTASSYSTTINSDTTLVWLLVPSESVTPKLKAKINKETKDEVHLSVKSKTKSWQLTIPFNNSADAKMILK
ncbi:alginate lyase family protein [Aurantibacter crassamenti]|uniref:alginate lyase family protein n=1 Tax=Aurantibacter crassamenti TaxID=1837375 RepID=UPI00193A7E5D|nr:alginate lyase family protein [Aurantibacter crassamenti]MBM1104528.1 alginate lyase family protein [Aurantibacter crassamenti]